MKKIFILILLIFLTGCDVKYNLTITNKEEVKEKFYVYIDSKTIQNSSMSKNEYLDYYSHLYLQNTGYKNYKVDTKSDDKLSSFIITREYSNLDDYASSISFKNMFNNANIERIGNYTSFQTSKNQFLENINNDELISEDSKNNTYTINIKFYNEVVNHNADKVDEKNNIYTWVINKDTTKDNLYFKIGPKVRYDVMIFDYIQNNLISIIVISGIILFILIASLYIYIKIKKNNEID